MVKMARVDVRNLPEDVVLKLTNKAKRAGVSRESYVRDILIVAANDDILEETEERYKTVIEDLIQLTKEQGDIIERNTMMMELLYQKLD